MKTLRAFILVVPVIIACIAGAICSLLNWRAGERACNWLLNKLNPSQAKT
jgi:hypothetical protein